MPKKRFFCKDNSGYIAILLCALIPTLFFSVKYVLDLNTKHNVNLEKNLSEKSKESKKKSKELIEITHIFEPVFDKNSKILILGTIPSPKSREYGFYYGHPQNNFWRVLLTIFNDSAASVITTTTTITIEEKRRFLLQNKIALWDVLHSCQIYGAEDGSIKNPVANDFSKILADSDIKAIFTTGVTATKIYNKYCFEKTGIKTIYLPSTSPANRKYYNFGNLVKEYKVIKKYL